MNTKRLTAIFSLLPLLAIRAETASGDSGVIVEVTQ